MMWDNRRFIYKLTGWDMYQITNYTATVMRYMSKEKVNVFRYSRL